MNIIDTILQNAQMTRRLEGAIQSVIVGYSADTSDPHDGVVHGNVNGWGLSSCKFSNLKCRECVCDADFTAFGVVRIGYVNSEGDHGETEIEASVEGIVDLDFDFLPKEDAEITECISSAFVNTTVHRLHIGASIPMKPNNTAARSPSRKRTKTKATERPASILEIELVPEGEMQVQEFAGLPIRKMMHNDEWFFAMADVVQAITGTNRPSKAWSDLKAKIIDTEGYSQLSENIGLLKMVASDGKRYETDCGNTETVFRVIQSINSPKAGPFKQWLAKVGYERIQEHQNPSIAIKRAVVDYQLQGRSIEWIDARLKTILSRKQLTDEWQNRGIKEGGEYAQLTDAISKQTFGKTTGEYKVHKALSKDHSLRDNMNPIELVLTMLGETATREIAIAKNAQGFDENQAAALTGGVIAGTARKSLERELGGASIVSKQNNLQQLPPAKELLQFSPSHEKTIGEIVDASKRSPKKGKK